MIKYNPQTSSAQANSLWYCTLNSGACVTALPQNEVLFKLTLLTLLVFREFQLELSKSICQLLFLPFISGQRAAQQSLKMAGRGLLRLVPGIQRNA